jgi:hypothetical protein
MREEDCMNAARRVSARKGASQITGLTRMERMGVRLLVDSLPAQVDKIKILEDA